MSEGLFDVPPSTRLEPGDTVRITTMWGTEFCKVVKLTTDVDDFPMVMIRTPSGDKVTIGVARVTKVD